MLLHNGNKLGSVPIGHSTKFRKQYQNIKLILKKIPFVHLQWSVFVDLKMVIFLLRQHSRYTKYPSFLCLGNSRAKNGHYREKDLSWRIKITVGKDNIVREPLMSLQHFCAYNTVCESST